MKKLTPLALFFSVLIITGCGNKNTDKEKISGRFIRQVVERAVDGNTAANDSLGGLINPDYPVNTDFNALNIDSIRSKSGNIYYTVLLEYPNPSYNRLAVYDTLMRAHLIDKSLNGNLTGDKISVDGLSFLRVIEHFISKDIFDIQRISLYSVGDSTVSRVFRTITAVKYEGRELFQSVDEITASRIKTSIKSNRYSPVRNKSDVFTFDAGLNLYKSSEDLFDRYIAGVIAKSKHKTRMPEITDEKSVWESVGVDPETAKTVHSDRNGDYSISLSEDWKELKDFKITEYVNKEFKGTRYLNNSIGTSISVFEIPTLSSAEDFSKVKLSNSATKGSMQIRFSDEVIDGKIFLLYYEYSCSNRKMMIIIKGSKFTYDDYKELYSKIANSFSMGC